MAGYRLGGTRPRRCPQPCPQRDRSDPPRPGRASRAGRPAGALRRRCRRRGNAWSGAGGGA